MQSSITNRLIMFEVCEDHDDHVEDMDTSEPDRLINQIQVDSEAQRDSELASIMGLLAITDFEPISMEEDSE